MGILAINIGHNGSVAYVNRGGEVVYYCEEERVSRFKRDGNPFRSMMSVILSAPIDFLVIGGTSLDLPVLPWTGENPYSALVRKYHPNVQTILMGHEHHLGHATSAFYNSGFDKAVAVVVDGAGSVVNIEQRIGFETESIYRCGYPANFETLYKNAFCVQQEKDAPPDMPSDGVWNFTDHVTLTKAYEAVSDYLGFGWIESGKTMGLSPYGKYDPNIPDFFDPVANKQLLVPVYPAGARINEESVPYLQRNDDVFSWHNDPELLLDKTANIAWKVQQDTQKKMVELVQKALEISGENNVVLAGGYALNCVANYHLLKEFPDVNFWVDPVAHDGGTAIGLALLQWHTLSQSTTVRPTITNVYMGTRNDYGVLDDMLNNFEGIEKQASTTQEVAQLIADGNIVALFQGAAEAGPRALGNRSILYDPRDPSGKDKVNTVKKREWFRPFAATVLQEQADEWFDLQGLPDSSFMSYAVDVRPEKRTIIPAVTHIDGSCRVQTVNENQNKNYYDLIKEFESITGIPLLFNTSFNLAGEPLVDSLIDALVTLANSEIAYLWLPEVNVLLKKAI